MPELVTFDKRATAVKNTVTKLEGEGPKKNNTVDGLLSAAQVKSNILIDMKAAVRQADAIRNGDQNNRAIDLDLASFVKDKYGFGSVDSFYTSLGINPSYHTMHNLSNMPDFDEGYRWLRPEIVREAVRLGLRRKPIYPDLVAAEESVTQRSIIMPHINMSDATPSVIGETETIPVGSVSFGEKTVKLKKLGTGLKTSDEVEEFVPLNILSIYLQDVGVQLGLGIDTMAIDVLLNGDDVTGGSAAPVIGVEDPTNKITYKDILRMWIRMGSLGRLPKAMLSNEDAALKILLMDEFKGWSGNTNTQHKKINFKTPIPQSQDYLVHGAMPTTEKLGIIDSSAALIKLNSSALTVESERIVERQLNGTYVTVTTGFGKLFRDAFIILDGEQAFSAAGFPSWMDVSATENVLIK